MNEEHTPDELPLEQRLSEPPSQDPSENGFTEDSDNVDALLDNPSLDDETQAETESPRWSRPYGTDDSRRLAAAAARVALENKGQDVVVLDVCRQSAEFDFFVLATGSSRRQLHAISEQIDDCLQKELGDRRLGIEGYEESRWIVLDYGSVVIHLFDDETRHYYDLESLWADGEVIPLAKLGLQ